MINTYLEYPFWKTRPEDVEAMLDSARLGKVHTLCQSAGGRTIRYLTYGEPEDYGRQANYNSACGARNPAYYANRAGKRPTILIFGATHGQETEGVAAMMNLISLLETGRDLRGEARPEITEAFARADCRLILLPLYNYDGRVRCEPDSMLGETMESLRHYGQGRWKDGSLCGWPECKTVHPIKEAVSFLGGYFNDDGVNLMQDNFFLPMAQETRALLELCDRESPECTVALHGGDNCTNFFCPIEYASQEAKEGVRRLAEATAVYEGELGFVSRVLPISESKGNPPPSFNLASAIHHVCGGVSAVYESNEGLAKDNGFSAEEILLRHYCMFRAVLSLAWRK